MSVFNTMLIKAAESCNIFKNRVLGNRIQNYGPAWFDNNCVQMKKQTRRHLRVFRKTTHPNEITEVKNKYLGYRTIYRNYLKAKRTLYTSKLSNDMTNVRNSRDFYKAISYFNPKKAYSQSSEYVNPSQFKTYFSNSFKCKGIKNEFNTLEDKEDLFLDREFDFVELNVAIKKLATCKAPGPDSIINEMLG